VRRKKRRKKMMGMGSPDQIISWTAGVIHWLFTWSCQAFLLLGLAWVGLKLDRSRSAITRYRIWLIALLAVAALPLLGALSQSLRLPVAMAPFPAEDVGVIAVPVSIPQAARPAFSWTSIIWPALFILWVAGVLISLLRLGNSFWKLHLIQSRARAVSLKDLDCSYSDLLHSDAGGASIALSDGVQSPGLAGLFRPVILLPADIMSWTSREERTSILQHEFAHIKRRDHIVSRFQSALRGLLFFHPLLRYADHQLSLEREIACDDRVLGLGAKPKAYAEAILKAAERSFLTDVVHHAASFNSRRTLERRIEMIMNTNRRLQPLRQWPFLLLPIMLIGVSAWMVIPAASSQQAALMGGFQSESTGSISAPSGSSTNHQSQLPPVVNRSTIIVDTVKRGTMLRQMRGLGVMVPAGSGRLKAAIKILTPEAKDIRIGQPASIDNRYDTIPGRVINVGSDDSGGVIVVDISLEGDNPQFFSAGMEVEGTIVLDRLDNVLYVQRPGPITEDAVSSLFKIEEDGATATRVQVKFGKKSITDIEILEGLNVGDKVIVSDNMSGYAGVNRIRLN
jgi:beta-lactamase regulating signal transducer with metallopeptidase domain